MPARAPIALGVILLFLPFTHAWAWRTTITSDELGAGVFVAADGAGDVVAAGHIDGQLTVVKLRGDDGRQVWRFQLPGPYSLSALVLAGRDPVVASNVADAGTSLIRLSSATGDEIWRSSTSGAFPSGASLGVDPVGDVVAGWVSRQLVVVVKYSGLEGREVWRAEKSTAAYSRPEIVIDARGDVVVGSSPMVKLDGASGVEVWKQDEVGDRVGNMFLDAAGDVIVDTDFVRPGAGVITPRMFKLSGRNGRVRWKTSPGAGLTPLAVQPSGHVFARRWRRGRSVRRPDDARPILLALGHSPRRLRWERAFPWGTAIARAATDGSRDVIVVAHHPGDFRFPSPSFVTKLRGTTGRPVWRQTLQPAPQSGRLGVNSLALDPLGNVVVAGHIFTAGFPDFRGFVVVKLQSDDGKE